MARAQPKLAVPMRTSGLAVPMTKASGLSVPTTKLSGLSMPQTNRTSNVRASGVIGAAMRDSAGYMAEIKKAYEAGVENMDALMNVMVKPERGGSRISYTNAHKHVFPKSTHNLLDEVDRDAVAGNVAVCVIENISPALIKALGSAWDIDPGFFATHASNPSPDDLWRYIGEWKPPSSDGRDPPPNWDSLDGIYEFHDLDLSLELMQRSSNNYCYRHTFKDKHWPVNVSTKISYVRVSSSFYLFLVDPPVRYEHAIRGDIPDRVIPSVRFPYAQNRGGVLLPSPFIGKHFVPFTALERIFRHTWQLELLFQPPDLFPNVPFLYLMSFSLWYSRLHRLDRDIKRVSFHDIRDPDLRITQTLHDMREDLSTLQTAVSNTQYFAVHGVAQFYRELWQDFPYTNMLTPLDGHEAIFKQATKLHRFLLETFQLLMNTITVRDSQQSIWQTYESLKQTRQSIILTRLATFYLPWTLTSGIYGMNLEQLNGSGLNIWVFGVTGVLCMIGTILVFQLQIGDFQPNQYLKYFTADWWEGLFRKRNNEEDEYNTSNQKSSFPPPPMGSMGNLYNVPNMWQRKGSTN